MTPAEGGATPQAVFRQLSAWRAAAPQRRWVVNATGGTKLMYDGAAEMRRFDNVEVVYRELGPNNLWFRLTRDADGPRSVPLDVPQSATDAIPVQTLVSAIWPTGGLDVAFDPPPDRLDLARLTDHLIASGGHWKGAFAARGRAYKNMSAGPLFERYVAAGLIEMGVTNLAHSVRQTHGECHVQEVDLVANYRSRLLVFDCKLRTEAEEATDVEPLMAQIRAASDAAKRLGGLSAEVALLRPNRVLDPASKALADALRVRVIDAPAVGRLFAELADFARCPPVGAPALAAVDAAWADPLNRVKVFDPESPTIARAAGAADVSGILSLDTLLTVWATELGTDWAAAHVRGRRYAIRYSGPASADDLRAALAPFARGRPTVTGDRTRLIELETDGNGRGTDGAFRAFLAGKVRHPLLG